MSSQAMILVLDNYDSFTYNLVQYLGEAGADPVVHRNDAVSIADVRRMRPDGIVVSPGPGVPRNAGISVSLVRALATSCPILGVCLGHQVIAEAFGGQIVASEQLMHGKASPVAHLGEGLFHGLPSPLVAMRYHSLVVHPDTVPDDLTVTAWTADRPKGREIMGLQHRELRVFGVQFHPESVGTVEGKRLVANFLTLLG